MKRTTLPANVAMLLAGFESVARAPGSWIKCRMELDEAEGMTECWDCNALVAIAGDRVYAFGEQGVLCFACAVRRGGAYDLDHERWRRPPKVADLPDERRSEQQSS